MLSARRVLVASFALGLTTLARDAMASPTSRLVYVRGAGAESCPDEPEMRRAVFILHELDEEPMPAVAETLGIPLNTGYSRLRVARDEFTTALRRLTRAEGELR